MQDTDARPRIGIRYALLALAILALAAAPAAAQQDLGNRMRQKLDRAQQLFEAVVLARFPAVGRYAGDLLRISEQSTWTPMATPSYLRYAGEFQEAARSLGQAAADRDIDEVSTALYDADLQLRAMPPAAARVPASRRQPRSRPSGAWRPRRLPAPYVRPMTDRVGSAAFADRKARGGCNPVRMSREA